MMPCTPGVLDVEITLLVQDLSTNQWTVSGDLETVGGYRVYNIDLDLFIDGNKLQTIHRDVLVPGETYSFSLIAKYDYTGTH
jgi:hypothetical protein